MGPDIAEAFAALGRAEDGASVGFAMVPRHIPLLITDGKLDPAKLPTVDYEYHVYADTITDNYIVVRGPEQAPSPEWRLVR